MMTNDEIIARVNTALESHGGLDNSVKFDFGDEGLIHVSGTQATSEDKEADCTISMSKDDFMAMAKRELDPMAAFMSGKLKLSGDMSVAMGLQSLFAKV